jgi:RNA polymerase sigma factor (sigma-70 family)
LTNESANIDIIIRGCRNGDRKAQESLYKSYYRAMITICLRYTKNDSDAVEVLNTAFLKVFKNIKRYDPQLAAPYTWIRTIVINSCIDFNTQRNRAQSLQELAEDTDIHIPPEAISKIKTEELLRLVRSLPEATRTVFNLYSIEGYSHKEIAQLLGISTGTSKWHLAEARKKLQELLQEPKLKMS